MRVRVEYFGKLSDIAARKASEIDLPAHVLDTAALRTWLDETEGFQGALVHPTVQLALRDEILNEVVELQDGDTIAFLPPVGGG